MGLPIITTDLTLISAADSTTGWTTFGSGTMLTLNDGLEGSGSILVQAKTANALQGAVFDLGAGATWNGTSRRYRVWVNVPLKTLIHPRANGGIVIQLGSGSSATANFKRWYVGGSDSAWIDQGWRCIILDPNKTSDETNGTFDITAIRWCGVGFTWTKVFMNAGASWDVSYHGSKVEITGGSDSEPITPKDVAEQDGLSQELAAQVWQVDDDAGPSFTDITTDFNDLGTSDAAPFPSAEATNDYCAIGAARRFGSILFTIGTSGAGGAVAWEYWSGSTWSALSGVSDGTNSFTTSGVNSLTFTIPTDWVLKDLDGIEMFYIRARITTTYSTNPLISNGLLLLGKGTYYGHMVLRPGNLIQINGNVLIGDESGTATTVFTSTGDILSFSDQATSSTGTQLTTKQDSGATTKVTIGETSGSGETQIGFNGSSFGAIFDIDGRQPLIDFSAVISVMAVYGSNFAKIGRGILFANSTGHNCIGNTFSECGQVDLQTVKARDLIFTGYPNSTDAALLWNTNINLKRSKFLANTNGSNVTAIEHNVAETVTYDALTFAGNDFDIDFTASGTLTVNAINGSNPSTEESALGNVVINNTVTVTVTVRSAKDQTVIQNARVLLEAAAGGPLPVGASVSITRSGSVATVTHTAHGLPSGSKVAIRGATQPEYNGLKTISNVTANTYDYTVSGSPATPATGSPNSTAVILDGLTNASGVITRTDFGYTSDQPTTGKSRKGTSAPLFKTAPISGTITTAGLSTTVFMVADE